MRVSPACLRPAHHWEAPVVGNSGNGLARLCNVRGTLALPTPRGLIQPTTRGAFPSSFQSHRAALGAGAAVAAARIAALAALLATMPSTNFVAASSAGSSFMQMLQRFGGGNIDCVAWPVRVDSHVLQRATAALCLDDAL